ncbi:hypothetical protein AB0A71_34395 [Kitasatospora aureofaciens]|uniref:hypothetical protein n=1 Tax=Kitasatospora aureofaciens TaxID=1894 RepID=UPI003403FD3D
MSKHVQRRTVEGAAGGEVGEQAPVGAVPVRLQLALDELVAGAPHARQGLPGAHRIAAAGFQRLTRELVRCAVIADRVICVNRRQLRLS